MAGGRTNHYWFDMNRDWLPVQLPESRSRIASFHRWLPISSPIITKWEPTPPFLSTGRTFQGSPSHSRNESATHRRNRTVSCEGLDSIGSLYFSGENYDDFYYGKGSTFPDINGSVGILFEQGSSRGHVQESENGLLTFPFTIRNQFTTAISTLEAARNMRQKLLDYQRDFYSKTHSEASGSKAKRSSSAMKKMHPKHTTSPKSSNNTRLKSMNRPGILPKKEKSLKKVIVI